MSTDVRARAKRLSAGEANAQAATAFAGLELPAWLSPKLPEAAPSDGGTPSWPRGKLYRLPNGALISAGSAYIPDARRRSVTILISVDGEPFDVGVKGRRATHTAVLLSPMTRYALYAARTRLAGAIVYPNQDIYRVFRNLRSGATLRLPRAAFDPLTSEMADAIPEGFGLARAQNLFDNIVQRVAELFPAPPPLDPRLRTVMRMVEDDPRLSMNTAAAAVGLSYHRLSHLFGENFGLPLKSYQVWAKTFRAFILIESGCTVSEAAVKTGFVDVEHLCRHFRDTFGMSPSAVYSQGKVEVLSHPDASVLGPSPPSQGGR
jgi:AraC-like DNA-binding protein